jgi:hypothetical protein
MANAINDDALTKVAGGAKNMLVIGTASVITDNLNIREKPDKESRWLGQTSYPAKYNVYEIVQHQGYIWYCIADDMWIANDGTWVHFSAK